MKNHTIRYSKDLMRYVRKYHEILQNPRRISQISVLPKDTRRLVMSGLANLSKFLGVYEHWKTIVKNAGLKWEKKVSLDIVLDIMNTNLQDCWTWLKAANSTRLISELDDERRLGDYFNQELLILEHFRYGKIFLRQYKNAYISFVTPQLLKLVLTCRPKIKYSTLSTKIRRLGKPNRTKQLRKYFATTLREYLPTEAIDLLQGRINRSVFLRYYYKPFLKDVRDKTLKGIEPLQNELLELLS